MTNLIGHTIGQYQIIEKIGKGGTADVYKAYQPGLDRYVAIKILPEYFLRDETFLTRFQREAKAIAKLSHPHILPVHDFGQQDDLTYIVMQYVEAGTLKDMLGQPLDLKLAVDIIEQVADALDYAHEQGIIHRDVKPSNVLMERGQRALLTDFGLAKMTEASVQLTGSGVGVGTPAYMSPEQGKGLPVDARSDVYSLGVVLYEMLTGQVPYEAETPMAVVIKHITAPLPLPREVNPAIPKAVERVVLKALAKDPADRYETAGELAEALKKAVVGVMEEAVPMIVPEVREAEVKPVAAPMEEAVPFWRRVPLWAWGAVGGVVLLLVVGGVWLAIVEGLLWTGGGPKDRPTLPDGWVYSSNLGGNWEIYIMEGGQPHQLTDYPAYDCCPSWSPDGSQIAFYRWDRDTDGNGLITTADHEELWVMNADGSNPIQVSADGGDKRGCWWSPDSRKLAFRTNGARDVNGDGKVDYEDDEVYVVGADGSGLVAVIDGMAADTDFVAWAPDSQWLIIMSQRDTNDDGQIDYMDDDAIYSVGSDGSGLTQLSKPGGDAYVTSVSPDGTRLAFWASHYRDSNGDSQIDYEDTMELYVMDLDGSGLIALTEDNLDDWDPEWSPDGRKIAFRKEDGGEDIYNLYTVTPDGLGTVRLTDDRSYKYGHTWAPDGSKIVFTACPEDTDGDGDLGWGDKEAVWLVSAQGGPIVELTDLHGEASYTWAPDSQHLAIRTRDQDANGDGRVDSDDPEQLFIVSADGRQSSGPLLGEGDLSCRWSEDGSTLYFVYRSQDTNGDGRLGVDDEGEIYTISADGTKLTRLSDREAGYRGFYQPTPTPSPVTYGGRIAFLSGRDDNAEIYVMNADGSGQTRLTNNPAIDQNPAWSPDGTRIAFISLRDGNMEIYVMNADGSGVTRLTDNPDFDRSPSWSPDGRRIAFMSLRDGNGEIYVMNTDGSGQTNLTNNPDWDGVPSWSPYGTRIAFTSNRDGNYEIYVMNADGSGVTRLTDNPAVDASPAWSPDGRRIAFMSDRDGDREIHVMNADGSGQTNLTNNPADDSDPSWSPDGTCIVFTRMEEDTNGDGKINSLDAGEIYVINADGSGQTNLTNNPANDDCPAWGP